MRFGIIIPAYNAAGFLEKTLQAVLQYTERDKILVVDDGSVDDTSERARKLGIECLRHEVNRGKGTALMTGMLKGRERGWEWALTFDADGQHDAQDLKCFSAAQPGTGTAIVVGRRKISGTDMPWHRRFSNAVTTRMISSLARKPVHDAQSGFRMYRLDLLETIGYPREGRFEWEAQALVLACRKGFSVDAVDVATVYSGNGSHMRLVRDTLRFLKMYWRLAWTL